MEPRRISRPLGRFSAVGIAAALIVGLTACADSSVPGDEADASGGSEADSLPVTISRGAVNIENILLAEQQGFLEEEGLDATMKVSGGAGGAATNSALVAGEFDIGATDAVTAIRAINENIPILVVAGTKSAEPDHEGDVSDGLIVPPGSDIEDWTDLDGRRIGVPEIGGLPYLTVVTGLEQNGIGIDDVEIVPLPLDTLTAAAESGQVDAIFSFSVFMLTALDQGSNGSARESESSSPTHRNLSGWQRRISPRRIPRS